MARIAVLVITLATCAWGCGGGDGDGTEAPGAIPDARPPANGLEPPAGSPSDPQTGPTPLPPLTLAGTLPHSGWSEGLDVHGGELWHAFPGDIRVFDLDTGDPLRRYEPPSSYSESLAWVRGRLWNVSYHDANIYVGETTTAGELAWTVAGTTPEEHGWGITFDGTHVILTGHGSELLYFLDPDTAAVVRTITTPIDDLEDLAWHDGAIWASSYSELPGQFFRVDPANGAVVDVHALPDPAECAIVDGLAVHAGKLYVTGKNCPFVYVYLLPVSEDRRRDPGPSLPERAAR